LLLSNESRIEGLKLSSSGYGAYLGLGWDIPLFLPFEPDALVPLRKRIEQTIQIKTRQNPNIQDEWFMGARLSYDFDLGSK